MLIRDQNKAPAAEPMRDFMQAMGVSDTYETPYPLPNMKPCEEKDFWGWRAYMGFQAEAWCGTVKVKDGENGRNPTWATLIVYYANAEFRSHGGFAVLIYRQYREERVEYFTWAKCDHQFQEQNIGRCLHLYTCSKCGDKYQIDSGD